MIKRKTGFAAVLVLMGAMATAACDLGTLGGAEAISIMGTDKTVVDHIVSIGSGKDCSTIRREQGRTYCVEDEVQINQNIHCYKSIGSVTCYDRPDPYNMGHARVDRNDHNLPE